MVKHKIIQRGYIINLYGEAFTESLSHYSLCRDLNMKKTLKDADKEFADLTEVIVINKPSKARMFRVTVEEVIRPKNKLKKKKEQKQHG